MRNTSAHLHTDGDDQYVRRSVIIKYLIEQYGEKMSKIQVSLLTQCISIQKARNS